MTQEQVELLLKFMEKIGDELQFIRENLDRVIESDNTHGKSAIMTHDVYRD
jgi:hypothetical protein